jgi:protein PhnA
VHASENKVIHKDAYGNVLLSGDNVVLIENLNVKGTNYIAPKGTQVKKIRLVADNAEQVEGKINSDTIVILTEFLKKA